VPVHAVKTYRGSESLPPLIIRLGALEGGEQLASRLGRGTHCRVDAAALLGLLTAGQMNSVTDPNRNYELTRVAVYG
jgi:hypothetical protein